MYSIFQPELHEKACGYLKSIRSYLNNEMSLEELEEWQKNKLSAVLEYAKGGSDFYQTHLEGIQPIGKQQSLSDYVSQLPFTTKIDLRDAGESISSQQLSQAWVYYETTGTTGPSTPCPRNEEDSLVNNTFLTLQYEQIFKRENGNHIVGVMGPTELHSTGDTFEDVFRSLGHTVVKMWPRSPVVGMERVLRLIQQLKITALVCTPAVASELAKFADEQGVDVATLGIEVILVLGELITPNRLKNLENRWNARIYNCMYASQETSILAASNKDNQLQTIPLNNFYELLDPLTGQALVPEAQQPIAGELVITHLYQGNKPLIRYRTGDMVRATVSQNGSWIIEPIGRVKDMIDLNGRKVYAFDLENLIFEELNDCYEYFVKIEHQLGQDKLTVVLEESPSLKQAELIKHITAKLSSYFEIDVQVVAGDVGSLIGTAAMVSWKAARIHDLRIESANIERSAAQAISEKRLSA